MTSRKSASSNSGPLPEGDDGRTIVDMNVEGMPWYTPRRAGSPPDAGRPGTPPDDRGGPRLTRRENWLFTMGALKAALAVVGVMCLGLVLFVLFCQHVWFR